MIQRLGIGAKLLLAFGSVFALALVAAMVGWFGFEEVARTQHSVMYNAIPAMTQARNLAELNARIIAASPTLTRASNDEERLEAFGNIERQTVELKTLLADIDRHGFDRATLDELRDTVGQITHNLERQNKLVTQRLTNEAQFVQTTAQALKSIEELTDIAVSLVANAAATATAITSNIYDMVDSSASRDDMFDVLDRLVEVDIDSMERMFELQLKSSRLSGSITQLGSGSELSGIAHLQDNYNDALTVLERRLSDINDPGRQTQAASLIAQLYTLGDPDSPVNVFRFQRDAIQAENAIELLNGENAQLAARLNAVVGELVAEGTATINAATAQAERAAAFGRNAFIAITIASVIVIGSILWFYVQRSVVRRLRRLETTTRALAGGDFEVKIDTDGSDELAAMAKALQVFRTNAIEKQRLENELREHQANLQRLVSERTAQLEHTNQKLAEEATSHANARERAEQANRAKTAFLATMSHELRTPMNGILGTVSLLREASLDAQQSRYADVIQSAGRTLLHILNDILGYSQMEAGKLKLKHEEFDLEMLVDDMMALMQSPAQEKGLRLDNFIHDAVPEFLIGDPGKLHQVLLNLIGNAIKFTAAGHVRLDVTSAAHGEDGKHRIRFEVSDSGVGIPEQHRDEVFDAFTQIDSSTARRYGGIGLGLAICKQLVSAMDGHIGIEKNRPTGTKIWFELPFEMSAAARTQEQPGRVADIQDVLAPLRVLVVEDDRINQMVTRELLENGGHKVLVRDNADDALRALIGHDLDLILMDIGLPHTDGVTITRRIRALPNAAKADIPVVAISAHVFQEEIEHYLAAGMNAFVGKPVEREQLYSAMTAALQGTRQTLPEVRSADTSAAILIDTQFLQRELDELGVARVNKLIRMFFDDASGQIDSLKAAANQNELNAMARSAHRLKGAAGNFGLNQFCALCARLEEAAKRGNTDDVQHLLQDLDDFYARSRDALEQSFERLSASQRPDTHQLTSAVNT